MGEVESRTNSNYFIAMAKVGEKSTPNVWISLALTMSTDDGFWESLFEFRTPQWRKDCRLTCKMRAFGLSMSKIGGLMGGVSRSSISQRLNWSEKRYRRYQRERSRARPQNPAYRFEHLSEAPIG